MLPLDILDKNAEEILDKHGLSMDQIEMAVMIDLDREEKYSQNWLVFSSRSRSVYYFTGDGAVFDTYDVDYYTEPLIENFSGSVRFIYNRHETKMPVIPDGTEEAEKKRLMEEYDRNAKSVIVCYATNKCKNKLNAFLTVIDRIAFKGETVGEDDELFKQFTEVCPKCGRSYPDGTKQCPYCDKNKKFVFRMFTFYKPHKWRCLLVLSCMMINSFILLITPYLQNKFLLNEVLNPEGGHHAVEWVIATISAIVGLNLVNTFTDIFQHRAEQYMSCHVTDTMRKTIFEKVQTLSLSFFGGNSVGNIITRIENDGPAVANFFGLYIPNTIWNTMNLIGMMIIVFSMNWKLSLIILAPVPLLFILYRTREPKYYKAASRTFRARSSMNGMVNDSLSGIRVVKAFAKEVDETHRFRKFAEKDRQANLYQNLMYLSFFPLVGLLIGMSSQVIWSIGGIDVINKNMSYADFVTYFSYVGLVFSPIRYFTTNFADALNHAVNSAQRFYETMDTKPDITETDDQITPESIKGDIELKNVNFSYDLNRPILKNVSMKINHGDQIGLVGHTGAGKSTIANLITRLYDPSSGSILIDGIDIKKINPDVLRKNMAIVSQEIFIFRGTVADNIRYARPDASLEEVIAAAKAANAHDFIMAMPRGYDTIVGIGSSRAMSGGEQQRISIARAILLAPKILILDEATAAMDTETERLIGKSLDSLVEGRTSISIAHRLSTLKGCNRLNVIENGEIVESGTHEELIRLRGIYYKLYKLQSEANKKIVVGG
ncbi:MAG: ATP-binding cassette domain-containing protein [Clostridia bacterium]|nr:ATP-binding cassette domain-containing protein [Clostridia bacterium]